MGTSEASYLTKQTSMSLGESTKRYKKVLAIQVKEAFTQTSVSWTQTEILHVELDDDSNYIVFDVLHVMKLLMKRLKLLYRKGKKGRFSSWNENKIVKFSKPLIC